MPGRTPGLDSQILCRNQILGAIAKFSWPRTMNTIAGVVPDGRRLIRNPVR
jgi:hypothetical protein